MRIQSNLVLILSSMASSKFFIASLDINSCSSCLWLGMQISFNSVIKQSLKNVTHSVMFQFVCPKRDPHFKELSKLHVLFHTMNNTNHIFIN